MDLFLITQAALFAGFAAIIVGIVLLFMRSKNAGYVLAGGVAVVVCAVFAHMWWLS